MKRIKKTEFFKRLSELMNEYTVYAPVGDRFDYVNSVDEINTERLLTRLSPKGHFLPQDEELFRWDENGNIKVLQDSRKFIAFGLRPCEVRAVSLLDPVFDTEEFPDPYYVNRRKNTIIVALACNNPEETCFCTSFGSGPFDRAGADILLVDVGEEFIGDGDEDMLKLFGFEESADEDVINRLKQEAEKKVFTLNLEGIPEKLERIRETEFFQEITNRCLTCGACTFLCPTCYCFDIQDRIRLNGGKRARVWDSCMFRIYTQETSGHNPRLEEFKRMRQRVMHKFSYYPELYNTFGCVGCGRCVTYCPVNFDIREVIQLAGGYNE